MEYANQFQRMIDGVGSENLSQEIIDDETIPDGDEELPTNIDFSIANDDDLADELRHVDFFDGFKAGIICPICLSPAWTLCQMKDSDKLGCYYCAYAKFHEYEMPKSGIKSLKFQERPKTEHPLNHVSYIGRSSRGDSIPHKSFENLIKFSMEWSEFPNRLTHVINYVDCYGANGSGLATYENMRFTLDRDAENYKYEPINDLVNRLQLILIPGLDKATFVMNRISGLTVKIQSLLKLITDLEAINIPPCDVSFVVYGSKSRKGVTLKDPYLYSGEEIRKIATEKSNCRMIREMKIGTFARVFRGENARNMGAEWVNTKEIDQDEWDEIDNEIKFECI